jgi:threonyl-tRNA synthetase
LLVLHVDSFTCTATQRGRSPLVEDLARREYSIEQGLLALTSVERGDEARIAEVSAGAAAELVSLARKVGAQRVMLHPFAHLFGAPAPAEASLQVLDRLAEELRAAGIECTRTPFGWFFAWDLRAKGHPLSRVARRIPAEEEPNTP